MLRQTLATDAPAQRILIVHPSSLILATIRRIEVRSRAQWRGHVARAIHIVPNICQDTLRGRCNDNVRRPRRYVLTELDIHPSMFVWMFALKNYKADHIEVQAGIINYLRGLGLLRLASVVWSGSKSMHAYWYPSADETVNRSFMEIGVPLGVDDSGWALAQFARIPNPGCPFYQEILYLDPPSL